MEGIRLETDGRGVKWEHPGGISSFRYLGKWEAKVIIEGEEDGIL